MRIEGSVEAELLTRIIPKRHWQNQDLRTTHLDANFTVGKRQFANELFASACSDDKLFNHESYILCSLLFLNLKSHIVVYGS